MRGQRKSKKANKVRPLRDDPAQLVDEADIDDLVEDAETIPAVKLTVMQQCELLAELSESILENPQGAFSGQTRDNSRNCSSSSSSKHDGPSPMQQLLSFMRVHSTDEERHVAQLATLSLLAVFKDILPSYRIKLPTNEQMAVKVSRDVKKLWDYERALLQSYQQYLKLLETNWTRERNEHTPLSISSILALTQLLQAAFHFNFRSGIITAVVKASNDPSVGYACCDALKSVFVKDAQGDVALEAARQLAKHLRERKFNVQPHVIATFRHLPLRVHADEAEAAKIATRTNRKKRKRDKETAQIESEMAETKATIDKLLLARSQTETLQVVMLTYFRIVKGEGMSEKQVRKLLPVALEGLAKFAHLINFDTVLDLLAVLKEQLQNVDSLPLDASLNCILTAFETLHGPGSELKIDIKEYIIPLYSQIPRFISEEHSYKHTEMLLKCLDMALLRRREFSTVRLAAFVKQILTVALHTSKHTSAPLLAFTRQLLQRYSSIHALLENEHDVVASGEYNPSVNDPDHSNPLVTSAWELATLSFHIDAQIVSQADGAATLKMPNLPLEGHERLRKEILEQTDDMYIPFTRNTKKHPLTPKSDGDVSSAPRFVKPHQNFHTIITD